MSLFKRGTYQDYFQKTIEAKKKALAEYEARQTEYIEKQSKLLYEAMADKESTPYGEGFMLEDMEKTFGISSWVYRCIMVIAWNIAPVQKKIFNEHGEDIDDHYLLRLLNDNPNPIDSSFDFREQLSGYLDLSGDALCEIVTEGDEIVGFTPMNPKKTKILADKNRYVTGYEYTVEGDKTTLESEDVIHWKYFNPFDDYWGLSPMSAAKLAIETDVYAAVWNRDFFKEGATPRSYIHIGEGKKMNPDEKRRMKGQWKKKFGGLKQQDIAILDGGAKIEKIGSTQSDMEFLEQRQFSREEILAVYGVPPVLAGIFQFSNRSARSAGTEQQQRQFWEESLLPRIAKMDAAFTKAFQDRDMNITVGSDLKSVKALQRDLLERANIAKIALQSGLTLNEVRTEIWEVDPIEEEAGNVVFLPGNLIPGAQNIEEEIESYIDDMDSLDKEKLTNFVKAKLSKVGDQQYSKDIQEHLDRFQLLVA